MNAPLTLEIVYVFFSFSKLYEINFSHNFLTLL